jgi:hypothetical protein
MQESTLEKQLHRLARNFRWQILGYNYHLPENMLVKNCTKYTKAKPS